MLRPIMTFSLAVLLAGTALAADPWADEVVSSETFGPFHSSALWSDPAAVLGKPNTMDRDDQRGDFTEWGPMRELHLCFAAWYAGSNNLADLDTINGGTNNGLGLQKGGQLVVAFDEPVEDNPADTNFGVDLIVHGNSFFEGAGGVTQYDTDMGTYTLKSNGAILAEPLTVSVAQSQDGPWWTFPTTRADALFPTNPWAWDADAGDWDVSAELDWTKAVDPSLTEADFAGLTGAEAISLYDGLAGGAGFDLADLAEYDDIPVDPVTGRKWIQYVKVTDPDGWGGEITGFVDAIPEPTSLALLSLGGLTMLWRRRKMHIQSEPTDQSS